MTLVEAHALIGRLVAYVDPGKDFSKGGHAWEIGRISSVGVEFVFVKYGDSETAQATRPEELFIVPGADGFCVWCDEPVLEGEQDRRRPNEAWHAECGIRSVLGSVGHQRGLCTCFGGPGTMDDPPGLTKRQAAKAAQEEYQQHLTRRYRDPPQC